MEERIMHNQLDIICKYEGDAEDDNVFEWRNE